MRNSIRGLAALAVLTLAVALPAQITNVAGTGCAGASFPVASPNVAKIATTVTFRGRLCAGRMPGFFILGAVPTKLPIGAPVMCSTCVLGTIPLVFFTSPFVNVAVPIPNDRNLIGACIYVQTGCQTVRRCFELDGALKVCIE